MSKFTMNKIDMFYLGDLARNANLIYDENSDIYFYANGRVALKDNKYYEYDNTGRVIRCLNGDNGVEYLYEYDEQGNRIYYKSILRQELFDSYTKDLEEIQNVLLEYKCVYINNKIYRVTLKNRKDIFINYENGKREITSIDL